MGSVHRARPGVLRDHRDGDVRPAGRCLRAQEPRAVLQAPHPGLSEAQSEEVRMAHVSYFRRVLILTLMAAIHAGCGESVEHPRPDGGTDPAALIRDRPYLFKVPAS